jgi:hypothetical protein
MYMQHDQPYGRSPALEAIPLVKAFNALQADQRAIGVINLMSIIQTDQQDEGDDALGGSIARVS